MGWSEFKAALRDDPVPGVNPNAPSRDPSAWIDQTDPLYDLLFVEFDDQGRPFTPEAIGRAMAHIEAVNVSADPLVHVFVHGWKHSARDTDDNVVAFRRMLHTTAHTEQLRPAGDRPRRVVGLYVAWRGLSLHWLNILQDFTFWGRKEAALRVALGSVRELFARLRRFRVDAGLARKASGARLVIVGHSFGGLIVHAALAEYLIESVAPATKTPDPVAPFGDLTVLVNPAFEAAKHYPLHSIVANRRFKALQPPVFICVTAENDWATGLAFPVGRHLSLWTGPAIGPREHDANFDTMGHVPWMITHELTLDQAGIAPATPLTSTPRLDDPQRSNQLDNEDAAFKAFIHDSTDAEGHLLPGWSRRYTAGALLRETRPPPDATEAGIVPDNPFWVVRASPAIVDGHNGIFRFVFLDFLRQVLDDTIRASADDLKR